MSWILYLEQSLNGLQFGLMLFLLASPQPIAANHGDAYVQECSMR